jgi:hypothetical protein
MVKAVVDIDQGIMTIGEELHSDEAELLEQGSLQRTRSRYVERAEI